MSPSFHRKPFLYPTGAPGANGLVEEVRVGPCRFNPLARTLDKLHDVPPPDRLFSYVFQVPSSLSCKQFLLVVSVIILSCSSNGLASPAIKHRTAIDIINAAILYIVIYASCLISSLIFSIN